MKDYNEGSNERHPIEVHVQYPEKFHDLHNDLQFLPERMKIEKLEKLVANLNDKTEYVMHKKNISFQLNSQSIFHQMGKRK